MAEKKVVELNQLSIVKNYVDVNAAKEADLSSLASSVSSHTGNTSNPHSVTKAQVGLGNVTNESKATMFTNAALTGTPTAPTAASGTNSTRIATTAFVNTEINNKIAAANALIYKGTVDASHALPTSGVKIGWTYVVAAAGTYASQVCEVGDMIIAQTATPTWTVIQKNLDGAVIGPSSAVDTHVATFNGTTGKLIKDSGYTIAKSVPSDAKFTDTVYTHPAGSGASKTSGLYKFSTDSTSHISTVTAVTKSDITGLGIPAQDTTYSDATTSTHGLMSTSDKSKLDGIASGANNYTLPVAASNALGGVKPGSTSGKTYGVDVGTDGSMTVNVPWTDTKATVTVTGSGNAITNITASDGALTATKGTTFLTSHQDISGKENTSNKVSAWSETTTNTKYPSEKLVKDSLDEKANIASLATVATTGSYNDLNNKPTIPTQYLKDASAASGVLTLTKQDDSTVTFESGSATSGHLLITTYRNVLTQEGAFSYQITNYSANDVAEVYINGLRANPVTDYQISSTGLITGKNTLPANTEIYIIVNQGFVYGTSGTVITITESIIQGLYDRLSANETAIASKADSNHNHDDRYYTETETDTKLASKADSSDVPTQYIKNASVTNNVLTIVKQDDSSFTFQGGDTSNCVKKTGETSQSITGDLSISGRMSAGSFNATSLRSKKENIFPFTDNALDIINNVDVVSFNFKDDTEKNYKVGFIADDTDKILSTVNHNQMDITNCIGVLLKAVQELSEEVKRLKEGN